MNPLSQDPITTTWMVALLVLFTIVVAVPVLRTIVAACMYVYANVTGRHHLRVTAVRVMPKVGHLLGSVVVGVASIAAPAAAATTSSATISIDRDGFASAATPQPSDEAQASAVRASTLYIVKTGDSLWTIAAAQLQSPTDVEITEQWKAIWRANRRVIGDTPEFIRPGMELVVDGASS